MRLDHLLSKEHISSGNVVEEYPDRERMSHAGCSWVEHLAKHDGYVVWVSTPVLLVGKFGLRDCGVFGCALLGPGDLDC